MEKKKMTKETAKQRLSKKKFFNSASLIVNEKLNLDFLNYIAIKSGLAVGGIIAFLNGLDNINLFGMIVFPLIVIFSLFKFVDKNGNWW